MMTIILAIVFGLLFGIILHRVGASDPHKIINMLRLKDFYLIKVILSAIGFSSLLVFVSAYMGIVDPHFSVKTAYIGVGVGGLIFGIGWAISGFCPGTGVVAVGTGRKDAFVFIIGGLVGAFLYMITYADLKGTFLFNKILEGKATLADTGITKYHVVVDSISSPVLAGGIAIFMILVAIMLPNKSK